MKKIILNGLMIFSMLIATHSCKQEEKTKKYNLQVVENDPMNVQMYTLDNGLKVNISVNKDEPRIQTLISVKVGSKNDPSDCTGLAHYLEHMLFKGSSTIGTTNWEEEKKLLQQISDLYEEHKNTNNDSLKKIIYTRIDSLSNKAVEYTAPNEYDKMVSSIGAKGTNAFTSNEQTVYVNDIPSNEFEKWLMIESNRFNELVLRLFHTELEAVYEEFNRAQDNDGRKAHYKMSELLFKKHPYGTQTTLGKGEHLKNPSMVKIHAFFDTYYVPNNMAINIAGDIDPEETIKLIDKYFGGMKSKPIPEFTFEKEDPITSPLVDTVYGPSAESVSVAFRADGIDSESANYIQLIDWLLNNGKAGLLDLNLIQKQKILDGGTRYTINKDYSFFYFFGVARQGQSLDEVRNLLLAQLDSIKQGRFEDWLPEAIINNIRLDETQQLESNSSRARKMSNAFILGQDWKDVVSHSDELKKITKADLVKFANENFNDNYVAIYKVKGEDKNVTKVDKPKITPLTIQRTENSAFYAMFDTVKSNRVEPVFVDYNTAISKAEIANKVSVSYIKNVTNDIFSLHYILDMGSDNDKIMALAIDYLPYLGTDKYTAEELQKEFFKLGLSFNVNNSRDKIDVSLSGLEDSFEKGVDLFEHILANTVPDKQALADLIQGIEKQRMDSKLNKSNILFGGLVNYAKYGVKSPFRNQLSKAELTSLTPEELIAKIKSLTGFKHRVFYYGTQELNTVVTLLESKHTIPESLQDYPPALTFTDVETNKNRVFFTEYDMVQNEMMMLSKGDKFNKDLVSVSSVFNEYFGSGLSSIVFQEIREAKALAYTAYCGFQMPSKKEENHYVVSYIGTQADKLKDASKAMIELMNTMPEAEVNFKDAKSSALKKIETDRITKSSIFWNYENAQKLGYDYDYRKDIYEEIGKMNLSDLKSFFDSTIKGKNYSFLVIGKKKSTDSSVLTSLGEVKDVKLDELFGY